VVTQYRVKVAAQPPTRDAITTWVIRFSGENNGRQPANEESDPIRVELSDRQSVHKHCIGSLSVTYRLKYHYSPKWWCAPLDSHHLLHFACGIMDDLENPHKDEQEGSLLYILLVFVLGKKIKNMPAYV